MRIVTWKRLVDLVKDVDSKVYEDTGTACFDDAGTACFDETDDNRLLELAVLCRLLTDEGSTGDLVQILDRYIEHTIVDLDFSENDGGIVVDVREKWNSACSCHPEYSTRRTKIPEWAIYDLPRWQAEKEAAEQEAAAELVRKKESARIAQAQKQKEAELAMLAKLQAKYGESA